MSHEIRTPMNAVIGMTSLLLDSGLTSEQREYASTVQQSGEMLLDIINDILDFSKIEAGRLDLESVDFDLPRLTDELAAVLAGKAHEKEVEIGVRTAPDVPRLVRGDPGRLRQVLINLIGNAIKFTERGEVVTTIAKVESAHGGVLLRFAVRDTGPGIHPEDTERLFEAFSQADTSTTRRHGGTGLGLAISKRLVAAMGGEIGVESEVGVGSTFWFTTHLGAAETETDADELAHLGGQTVLVGSAPSSPPSGLRVLVVEDNAVNQRVAVRMLEKLGYDVDVAANGRAALDAVGRRAYDLVLMDCQMPEMDGFEACRRIRQREGAGLHLPIIAMTANALQGDRERCLEAGMDDYLPKPVTATALKKAIDTWLGRAEALSPAPQRRWAT